MRLPLNLYIPNALAVGIPITNETRVTVTAMKILVPKEQLNQFLLRD